jgi:hypothetical protein
MKKLLTSLSLLCLSLPAYCEEVEQYVCTQYGLKDALETIWIILKFLSPIIILFFIVLAVTLLLEWYASDVENHPERKIILIIMNVIFGILTLGLIFMRRK